MSKTVLVLTGSAREGGNSDLLAEAFIRGALDSGKQILGLTPAERTSADARDAAAVFQPEHPV